MVVDGGRSDKSDMEVVSVIAIGRHCSLEVRLEQRLYYWPSRSRSSGAWLSKDNRR